MKFRWCNSLLLCGLRRNKHFGKIISLITTVLQFLSSFFMHLKVIDQQWKKGVCISHTNGSGKLSLIDWSHFIDQPQKTKHKIVYDPKEDIVLLMDDPQ